MTISNIPAIAPQIGTINFSFNPVTFIFIIFSSFHRFIRPFLLLLIRFLIRYSIAYCVKNISPLFFILHNYYTITFNFKSAILQDCIIDRSQPAYLQTPCHTSLISTVETHVAPMNIITWMIIISNYHYSPYTSIFDKNI